MLATIGSFWDRFGRIASGAVIAVVVVLALVVFTTRSRRAVEQQASGRLAEAQVLFWQNEYARSMQLAKQVIQQYGSTPSGIDAHRLVGDDAYWTGDFATAITEYQAYLARQKTGILADAVRRSLAYSLESSKRYGEAAATFEGLVGKFDRESSAEFLAAAARCHRAMNQPGEAIKRLQRLLDEFGETSSAQLARVTLAELQAKTP